MPNNITTAVIPSPIAISPGLFDGSWCYGEWLT